MYNYQFDETELDETCSRDHEDGPCQGELFVRVSRSGLTSSTICEFHAGELEASLDNIASRYPEINHPEYCGCHGCTGNPYNDPYEAGW